MNVYLEDWSSGVSQSFDYVFAMVQLLRELRVARVYLPDTLGILDARRRQRATSGLMTARPGPHVDFEFHGHNDYSLGHRQLSRPRSRAGARGIHTSVNSMGERAGNYLLSQKWWPRSTTTPPHRTGVEGERDSSLCHAWSRPSAART